MREFLTDVTLCWIVLRGLLEEEGGGVVFSGHLNAGPACLSLGRSSKFWSKSAGDHKKAVNASLFLWHLGATSRRPWPLSEFHVHGVDVNVKNIWDKNLEALQMKSFRQ